MLAVAYRNTESGIRALHRQIATFETTAKIEAPTNKWKSAVVMTPYKRIEMRACKVFGVSLMELRATRRHDKVSMARQFIYYWATRLTPMSLGQIGRLLGGRDHTTVLHGKEVYPKKRAKKGRYLRPAR